MAGDDCSAGIDRVSLLERRVRELEQLETRALQIVLAPGLIAGLLALAPAQSRRQLLWSLFLLGRGVGEGAGTSHQLRGVVSSHPS